jgi:hypothetical protein
MCFAAAACPTLTAPREEWHRIATEPASVQSIYTTYVMLLAAIGPIVILVSLAQLDEPGYGFAFALRAAVIGYVSALIVVALLAAIVDVLAASFGGTRDYLRSIKLVAYSFTPVFVAQLALLVPLLGWLLLLAASIYAFYLFFLGGPVLDRCSDDKAASFTIVVVLCAIVLTYLVQSVILGVANLHHTVGGNLGMLR